MAQAAIKLDHFPAISQIEELAQSIGASSTSGWKYLTIPDCLRCGGCGWHWVRDFEERLGPATCDQCSAGKNLLAGPKIHRMKTQKELGHRAKYMGPGTRAPHKEAV